jgi:hypothetical protein
VCFRLSACARISCINGGIVAYQIYNKGLKNPTKVRTCKLNLVERHMDSHTSNKLSL